MLHRWQKVAITLAICTSAVSALPDGAQIIQGNLQVVQPAANVLQILQSSPTGIINWGSFNVNANQLVQFLQPNSSAALLNRVIGQDPSQIFGQIQANGTILLVNPNGILFGPGSSVNAGSFLASTLSIQDQDFLQGRYDLRWDGTSTLRAVTNHGEIKVADGGFLAIVSPLIDNQGLLLAERGQVFLGATRRATLTVDARGLLQVVVPNGFASHAQSGATPQSVLLTPGQMSDTLSALVSNNAAEGERIVHTAQGVQIVGGEGLLVNSGTVRADAGQGQAGVVLMDSSQATYNSAQSLVSASSAAGNAGQILVLSAGTTLQNGQLQARSSSQGDGGFIEVSGSRVGLHRAPDLSAAQGKPGALLIDPRDLTIVQTGGSSGLPIDSSTDPGMDVTVDVATLDMPFSVTVTADRNVTVDTNVHVDLTQNTDLTINAGNDFFMNPGSRFSQTDPSAVLHLNAGNNATVQNLNHPTTHVTAVDTIYLNGGTAGQAASATLLDLQAAHIVQNPNTNLVVSGSTEAQVNLTATQDVILGDNSSLNLQGGSTRLDIRGDGGGITFQPGAVVTLSGGSNHFVNLDSASSSILFLGGSSINALGSANITLTSPLHEVDLRGGSIAAQDPLSTVNITSHDQLSLGNLTVPTSYLTSTANIVQFNNSNLGVAGGDTVVNVTGTGTAFFSGTSTNILGNTVTMNITSSGDAGIFDNAQLNLNAPVSNLGVTAPNGFFLSQNAQLNASGASNITLTSDTGPVTVGTGASINVSGVSNVTLTSTGSSINGFDTGSINLDHPNSQIHLNGFTNVNTGNLKASKIEVRANNSATLANITVGQSGTNGALKVTADQVFFIPGVQLQGNGPRNDVNINGTTEVRMNDNSSIRDVGIGNYSLVADTVDLRDLASIDIANPAGHVSLHSTNGPLLVSSVRASNLDFEAEGGNLIYRPGATLGRPGSLTAINASATGDVFFLAPQPITVEGSHLDWTQTSDSNIILANDGRLRLNATTNNVSFDAVNFVQLGDDSRLSSDNPTQLDLSGYRILGFPNSHLSLPNAASNVNITSTNSILISNFQVGGRFNADIVSAGNVRLTGQLQANDVVINASNGELSAELGSLSPAILANNSLNITATNISGQTNLPEVGLVRALPFATGANARVRFNISGTNSTGLADRAANLFYYFPQSSDLQIDHPNGDVFLYQEPNPNPNPPPSASLPSPPPASGTITSRNDLTSAQFVEVTNQAAISQIQLSNIYAAAYLPFTSKVLMLEYDNIGLTYFNPVSLSSAVVELVIVSPDVAARQLALRDSVVQPDDQATSLIIADDDDEELRYFRRLIEGFILWESD